VLKNAFRADSEPEARNLLILLSTNVPKFAEITGLVRFSTAGDFAHNLFCAIPLHHLASELLAVRPL
jgi:hypothetical protein